MKFEEALVSRVEKFVVPRGDVLTATGNNTGRVPHCRVGDMVWELGPDHVAAGAKIVIEAKQNQSVDLRAAREEIELARKNREADVGVFIYSIKSAPADMPCLNRLGQDVFLVWDAEDASTDLALEAGLSLASAMVVQGRGEKEGSAVDIDSMEKAVLAIEKQVQSLDEFDGHAQSLLKTSEKIENRARIMRKKLMQEVIRLNSALEDLRLEQS